MATGSEIAFARQSRRDTWQLFRHLLGGALILLVWVALWTWVAAGVVRPLSAVPPGWSQQASDTRGA